MKRLISSIEIALLVSIFVTTGLSSTASAKKHLLTQSSLITWHSRTVGQGEHTRSMDAPLAIHEFQLPKVASGAFSIVMGSDKNLWFTESEGNRIGRITTKGVITEFTLPKANSFPYSIVTGSDGNLWFTEYNGNKIGRITPQGMLAEFTLATANSNPYGITIGPDGNLWFTEYTSNRIGYIV